MIVKEDGKVFSEEAGVCDLDGEPEVSVDGGLALSLLAVDVSDCFLYFCFLLGYWALRDRSFNHDRWGGSTGSPIASSSSSLSSLIMSRVEGKSSCFSCWGDPGESLSCEDLLPCFVLFDEAG